MEKFFDIIPPGKIYPPRRIKITKPRQGFLMNRPQIKIICLLLIIGLNWTGLLTVGRTLAYFFDTEESSGNIYTAGSLNFYLSSDQENFVPLKKTLNLEAGDEVNRVIQVINGGTLSFQYTAQTEKILGDDDFCNALRLTADLGIEEKYDGGLMGFSLSAIEMIDPPGIDTWHFKTTLFKIPNLQNKICQIKFVFEGWQTNFLNPSSGFSDKEEIESDFASWGLRINEVYYDIDGSHGAEGDNEWVEIYNQTNQSIDISGWKIADNISEDVIPSSASIPANGFAIITADSSTWGFWPSLPSAAVKIVLGSKIGNGLANDGDRVILRRPDGQKIDAMSYGTDAYAFAPACPDVLEGHSLARDPKGFDTNKASDFIDLDSPNPGDNPHFVIEEQVVINEEIITDNLNQEIPTEETTDEETATEEETPLDNPDESGSGNEEEIINENSDNGEDVADSTSQEGINTGEETTDEGIVDEGTAEETTEDTVNSNSESTTNIEETGADNSEEGSPIDEEIPADGETVEETITDNPGETTGPEGGEEELTNEEQIGEDNTQESAATEDPVEENNSNETNQDSGDSGEEQAATIPEDEPSNLLENDSSDSGVNEEVDNNNSEEETDSENSNPSEDSSSSDAPAGDDPSETL